MKYNLEITRKDMPQLELEVLDFWQKNKIFQRSVDERPEEKQYILYDGPPFATGLPHYGHVLAHTIKDVFPRYHTMQGQRVERRFGWDCHGVPVEYEVEKDLKLQGHVSIQSYGIANFNEACRSIVQRYTKEWRFTEDRLGRFVDMDNDYKTMEPKYMESVWSVFKILQDKGLVYEGKKVVAYSGELGTPLSDFESKLNYKNVQDPQITMVFPLVGVPKTSLLVWTTTPWSVPSNIAIALNTAVKYVKVTNKEGQSYILAESAVSKFFEPKEVKATEIDVNTLIGVKYEPMFEVINNSAEYKDCFTIQHSEHVTAEDGTGLVHIAPAFGEDDYRIGAKHKLPVVDLFNENCVLSNGISKVDNTKGLFFKDADKPLIEHMKKQHRIFRHVAAFHDYPFCWRTDKPLMYRAVPSWYIKVTAIKQDIINNNEKINWYPDHIGKKRFNDWLSNARDWSVSRDRYWGCPIPIWRNTKNPTDLIFVSSIAELETLTGAKITDIHRHFIDHLEIKKGGNTYRRIPQVFDCWFESGAMPYAQQHYPFEAKQNFERYFPADFIAEGLDQTRGWFYTLMVLSTALFNQPAFKNCVVNGILLGNDGKKMSKSKKNYPDINEVFVKYGADALRMVLMGSKATQAQEMSVNEKDIESAVRQIQIPILNIYKFFATEANKIGFYSKQVNLHALKTVTTDLDQWLIYRTEEFLKKMTQSYDKYNVVSACNEIRDYIDDFSRFYIRNVKTRFKVSGDQAGKSATLCCMQYAFTILSQGIAPILPYISEALYRELYGLDQSVHLTMWPKPLACPQYKKAFDEMQIVRDLISLGNTSRNQAKIKLQQPLSRVYISVALKEQLLPYINLIKQELNVEEIEWTSNSSSDMLESKLELNNKALGQKYKKEFQSIKKALETGEYKIGQDKQLYIAGKILTEEEYSVLFSPKAGICGAQLGTIWLAMNTQITPELEEKGSLRSFIHEIQMVRKKLNYDSYDRVVLRINGTLKKLVKQYKDQIEQATKSTIYFYDAKSKFKYDDKSDVTINQYTGTILIKHAGRLKQDTAGVEFETKLTASDLKSAAPADFHSRSSSFSTSEQPVIIEQKGLPKPSSQQTEMTSEPEVKQVINQWASGLLYLLNSGMLSKRTLDLIDTQVRTSLESSGARIEEAPLLTMSILTSNQQSSSRITARSEEDQPANGLS